MRDVYVTGTGIVPFGKYPDRTITAMAEAVVSEALADAGADPERIGFVAFGNAVSSVITGQAMIQGQLALANTPLSGTAIVNVENACSSGATAFGLAAMAIRSGMTDVAVAIGVEKMTSPDKALAFQALETATDVSAGAGAEKSVFMPLYAEEAAGYLRRTDAPADIFAVVASKTHYHGSLNPNAQYRTPHSPEEVAASRMIEDPLTLLMCSPIGDGAAALVLSVEPPADGPAVRLAASALRSGRLGELDGLVVRTGQAAFDGSGLTPADIDVVELHDAAAPAELLALEELGLFEEGTAWRHELEGETRVGGGLPVNTGGGLIARGHPVGATGCAQLVELTDQLRGRLGARQVEGARVGLAQNAGGAVQTHPYTPAVNVVTLLEAR
jgi:acetyl-CoA acyltransferase